MKVGYLQFQPKINCLAENIQNISFFLNNCEDFDLVVLPELANSGYNFSSKEEALANAEEINKSKYINALTEICKKRKCHIVSGFCELENGKLYNSSVLINEKGVLGVYRKLHLFFNEQDYFEPGNLGLPIFSVNGVKIGMLVCFDWMFPEVWRILAMKGADIICHPSNLVLPYAQKAVPIYALTNRVFTITANRIGTEGDLKFTGQSVISDTRGEILCKASETAEELMFTFIETLDAKNKMITAKNHIFKSRRPDEYLDLIK
ncbi:MAG: nitrilase-related carbon-nitrogen hydrolase [Bacteroidota bacterium]